MKASIIKERCAADKRICKPFMECPEKAIQWIEDDNELLGCRMEVDSEKCVGCSTCVPLCCGGCIVLND